MSHGIRQLRQASRRARQRWGSLQNTVDQSDAPSIVQSAGLMSLCEAPPALCQRSASLQRRTWEFVHSTSEVQEQRLPWAVRSLSSGTTATVPPIPFGGAARTALVQRKRKSQSRFSSDMIIYSTKNRLSKSLDRRQ